MLSRTCKAENYQFPISGLNKTNIPTVYTQPSIKYILLMTFKFI